MSPINSLAEARRPDENSSADPRQRVNENAFVQIARPGLKKFFVVQISSENPTATASNTLRSLKVHFVQKADYYVRATQYAFAYSRAFFSRA